MSQRRCTRRDRKVRWHLCVAFAILLLALTSVVSLAQQPLPGNDAVGVCTHFGHGWDPEALLPRVQKLGVGWIRDGIYWPEVEPKPGEYYIPVQTQRWVDEAHRRGLKVLFSFSKNNPNYAGFDADAYARAAAYVVTALRGKVQAIEILNEPNNAAAGFRRIYGGDWSGLEKDGSLSPWLNKYLELLNKTASAVRKANPDMKVIGLGATSSANLRALPLIAGAVDGITDHPYSSRTIPETSGTMEHDLATADGTGDPASFQALVARYRASMRDAGRDRELWFTEWGFSTFHEEGRPNPGHFAPFTEQEQALYVQRRLLESLAAGVDHNFVYDLRNDGNQHNEVEANFGLLYFDGTPKPAYDAMRRVMELSRRWKPGPARQVSMQSRNAKAWRGYLFSGSGGHADLILWAVTPRTAPVMPAGEISIDGCSARNAQAEDLLTGKRHGVGWRNGLEGVRLSGVDLSAVPQRIQLDCR